MAGFRLRMRGAVSAPPPDPDPDPSDLQFTIPTTGTADLNMTLLTKDIPAGNTANVAVAAGSPVPGQFFR